MKQARCLLHTQLVDVVANTARRPTPQHASRPELIAGGQLLQTFVHLGHVRLQQHNYALFVFFALLPLLRELIGKRYGATDCALGAAVPSALPRVRRVAGRVRVEKRVIGHIFCAWL